MTLPGLHSAPAAADAPPPDLLDALRAGQRFLVLSHIKPDGDAIGSLLGMVEILRAAGKQATPALQDPPSGELLAIPGADEIRGPDAAQALRAEAWDAVIATDCSSLDRLGALYGDWNGTAPLLVIDHHVTNTRFGAINWVAPTDAAACQMLVSLADALGVPLRGRLAQVLLTGLVTDTLCFRTSSTTPAVLETGMRLLAAGASLTAITENILDQKPFSVLKLWGLVLDDVQIDDGIIWVTLPRAAVIAAARAAGNHQGDREEAANDGSLSSMLIRTEGAAISATFLEKLDADGRPAVECSFRARRGYDISGVALGLGGGGHPAAGGATVPGALDDVARQVVAQLKQVRQSQAAQAGAARTTESRG